MTKKMTKENNLITITVREELMSTEFPSIWLEIKTTHRVPLVVGGIYREWL